MIKKQITESLHSCKSCSYLSIFSELVIVSGQKYFFGDSNVFYVNGTSLYTFCQYNLLW